MIILTCEEHGIEFRAESSPALHGLVKIPLNLLD